jgi:2-oxoglutarate ferredoxin oxidoreductase subunit gamma
MAESKVRDTFHIRLCGSGGQGLLVAGIILAEAATRDGKFVVQTQSYGPEARLGASRCEVIVSSRKIAFPRIVNADILLCLSEDAYQRFGREVNEGSLTIIDSSRIHVSPESFIDLGETFAFPISDSAKELGNVLAANILGLGILNAAADVVSWESLSAAVLARIPKRFHDLNAAALQKGRELWASSLKLGTVAAPA